MVSLLCACGGGGASSTPVVAPTQTPTASLPAAIATGCVAQQTAAQTAPLPAAGGMSGTISIGATAASGTCLGVTVAKGADAALSATRASAATTRRGAAATATSAPSPLPPALAQVSLTNTYTGNLTWVTITLQLPTGTVPPGQYPATITSTIDLDGTVDTTVANFTVTVSANGQAIVTGPSAARALAILAADTTGVLAIYPPGTVLPTPSPAPTVVPTTAALKVTISPSTCQDAGNTGATFSYQAAVNTPAPAGAEYLYRWFATSIYATRWTVTLPTVTINSSNYGPLTTSDRASITAPIYATVNDITGETGGMEVMVFYYYPTVGSYDPVQDGNGTDLVAAAPIAAGTLTCHGLGL